MKKDEMKQAQTWSTDAVIAILIFVVILISAVYLLQFAAQNDTLERLKVQGERVPERLATDEDVKILDGTEIDRDKLEEIAEYDYERLKAELGIQADFCLHFEDEEGNLINISPDKAALGSDRARVGGFTCGE